MTAGLSTKATEIQNKMPVITNLNIKCTEIQSEIPGFTNLAPKATLNTITTEIKSKIPDTPTNPEKY